MVVDFINASHFPTEVLDETMTPCCFHKKPFKDLEKVDFVNFSETFFKSGYLSLLSV